MTLRISLRDGEKMIVNGAVLCAVGRIEVLVENHAAILRDREVMTPEEATTPARRLYYACMMAYIQDVDTHRDGIVTLLGELMDALESDEARKACIRFANRVALSDYYRALAECRGLIAYEIEAFGRVNARAA